MKRLVCRPNLTIATWVVILAAFLDDECLAIELRAATFQIDVTPPLGSPLCDGLVPPTSGVNDPLSARGVVLQAENQAPVVLVAVDWVGIGNEGHDAWIEAIAQSAGTACDRVCVHCLHQHDAPGCDFLAERIAADAGLAGELFPVEFAHQAIENVAAAVSKAALSLEPVTHVGFGRGIVEKVASNRRILGNDGKVRSFRYTATASAALRALPEGTVDPIVRLVSLWNGDRPIVVLSYYATHPQSYYQTGNVSADFPGMARHQREVAVGARHIHFNGAGGNIGAGKYNDGSPENRPLLAARLAEGMKKAWNDTRKVPISDYDFHWQTEILRLPLTEGYDEVEWMATLQDTNQSKRLRLKAARDIAWAERVKTAREITVARLRLGPVDIVHAPGELFVEYQLAAQEMRPESFVCMAAYGDYGPGYIGTAIAYEQGGYETGRPSRVSPRSEQILLSAFQELLE